MQLPAVDDPRLILQQGIVPSDRRVGQTATVSDIETIGRQVTVQLEAIGVRLIQSMTSTPTTFSTNPLHTWALRRLIQASALLRSDQSPPAGRPKGRPADVFF
jgi:hypothetical protein